MTGTVADAVGAPLPATHGARAHLAGTQGADAHLAGAHLEGRHVAAAHEVDSRHPLDPDPVRSTKAAAVLALGVAAIITGPVVGGIIPATVGLALAKQARGDLVAGRGYLVGARYLRLGLALAWVGIGLAAAALVVASVLGIISLADGTGQDFPDTSD